ncbi:DUF4244 domain-containing protein [Arthrobacter sp. zg-Y750]|uniref:DUF4244 domain-containing protein n=1 Tax=Arthrobacter sp. zg-Y750 TaxID=2894189 RepID=UPI002F41E108
MTLNPPVAPPKPLAAPLIPPAMHRLPQAPHRLPLPASRLPVSGPLRQERLAPDAADRAGANVRPAPGARSGSRCSNPESDGRHGVYLLSTPPAAPSRPLSLMKPADAPAAPNPSPHPSLSSRSAVPAWTDREAGMATAEYAIATLAAVAFAGLLAVVLGSDEVRSMLVSLIRSALTLG